jgi:hypothetical protein
MTDVANCGGCGKACLSGQICANGACVTPTVDLCFGVVCPILDQCHAVGTCNPATGRCSNPALQDGTICTDGNACTSNDKCQAGVCTGLNPVVCSDGAVCDPVTGQCGLSAAGVIAPADSPLERLFAAARARRN